MPVTLVQYPLIYVTAWYSKTSGTNGTNHTAIDLCFYLTVLWGNEEDTEKYPEKRRSDKQNKKNEY